MKVKKIPADVLCSQSPIMSEDQIEGVLFGYFYRVTRTVDRGPGAGSKIMRNHETGLPESADALMPIHRAVGGVELALSLVITPEKWAAACIYTDDLDENVGKTEDQKEWRSLFAVAPEKWTGDALEAVKVTTRRLKVIVHRLESQGLFVTSPQIDETEAELGTTHLAHGDDKMTMGFQITYAGVKYAEEFVREHPSLQQGHSILDALGKTLSSKAPEWKQAQERHSSLEIT
jgi:hypothetical protein